jgi:putative peptide zinc metalloprotease protein
VAGVYFQLIYCIPFIALYLFTGIDAYRFLVVAINLSLLFHLNPFFKFDGYWVCSDILGIPNLRERTYDLTKYFAFKVTGRRPKVSPFFTHVGGKEKIALLSYGLLVNAFFGYYLLYRVPLYVMSMAQEIPSLVSQLYEVISLHQWPDVQLVGMILFRGLLSAVFIYFIVRMAGNLFKFIHRVFA